MKKKTSILLMLCTVLALICVVPQAQAAVKLSKKTLVVTKGKTATLKVNGTKKKAVWSSSNKKIATVTQKGVVSGKKAGTAKITAKIGKKKYTCAVTVTPKVTYNTYKHKYFTASIPKGWKVEIGLMGTNPLLVDLVSYGIRVYDPKNTDRCVYLCLNAVCVKSEAAHERQVLYYNWGMGSKSLADAPVVSEAKTKTFFKAMESFYGMQSFSVSKNLGKAVSGGDILLANAKSKASGKKVQGIFTAYVSPETTGDFVSIYSIVIERARSSEFAYYQPILDHVLSSIKFTKAFQDDRAAAWEDAMGTAAEAQANGDAISSMIMKAWNKQMQ